MWAAIEQQGLNFLRTIQPKLGASLDSGFEDALHHEDHTDLNDIGQRAVLPSWTSSRTAAVSRFMAIARHYRDVDIFMTVTTTKRTMGNSSVFA
jgi:hypothetical protein